LGPDPENKPSENFRILWENFDQHYSRFELKGVDWDSLYSVYQPLVADDVSGEELFEIISSMLSHLKDMHAILETPYGVYRYWPKEYENFFDLKMIETNYLIEIKRHSVFTYGELENNLGYIHISSFGVDAGFFEIIDSIVREFENFNGVIIDVRNNSGGNSSNSQTVASRFTDSKRIFSYNKYRNGPNHNDFSELFPSYIAPEGTKQFTKPIAVLTDRFTASAAEDFVMMMKVIPYVTTVGDTTLGAIGGSPKTRELPNGWVYRLSTARNYSFDFISYEGVGIPPDIFVRSTESDSLSGKDAALEKAIELLR